MSPPVPPRLVTRLWRRLRGTRQSPARVAEAVALGLFIGCLPLYGLHFLLCLSICVPLGLDLLICYLVANISNPLVAPFLVVLEVELARSCPRGIKQPSLWLGPSRLGFWGLSGKPESAAFSSGRGWLR